MLCKLDYLEHILARSITQRLLAARVLCNGKFAHYIAMNYYSWKCFLIFYSILRTNLIDLIDYRQLEKNIFFVRYINVFFPTKIRHMSTLFDLFILFVDNAPQYCDNLQ